MKRFLSTLPALLLLAGLAVPDTAWALRCGNRLILEGDPMDMVRSRCGQPTDVRREQAWRPPVIWRYGRPIHVGSAPLEVRLEVWTYNLGPNLLMREVHFEEGKVKRVDTLGYGYR